MQHSLNTTRPSFVVDKAQVATFRASCREMRRRMTDMSNYRLTLTLAERNILWDLLQVAADQGQLNGEGKAMAFYVIGQLKGIALASTSCYAKVKDGGN